MIQPGGSAPDFQLPDLYGDVWNLGGALRAGPVVLAFFKVTCPACRTAFPLLERLAAPGGGFQLIAISQDDVPDTHEFQQRLGLSMRTLVDAPPDYAVSRAYRVERVPSIFVIESGGRIDLAAEDFNKAAIAALGRRFGIEAVRASDHTPDDLPGCRAKG